MRSRDTVVLEEGSDILGTKQQAPRVLAHGIKDRIGNGCGRRDGTGFAGGRPRQVRSGYELKLHVRHLGEGGDRVVQPIDAGYLLTIEADLFVQCPAQFLKETAFDLIVQPVWIEHEPAS